MQKRLDFVPLFVGVIITLVVLMIYDAAWNEDMPRKADVLVLDQEAAIVQVYYINTLGKKRLVTLDRSDHLALWQEAMDGLRTKWGSVHRSVIASNGGDPTVWLAQKK